MGWGGAGRAGGVFGDTVEQINEVSSEGHPISECEKINSVYCVSQLA